MHFNPEHVAHDSVVIFRSMIFALNGRHPLLSGVVVVVSVLLFDLQLLLPSVHITTKLVSSNPVHGDVYSI